MVGNLAGPLNDAAGTDRLMSLPERPARQIQRAAEARHTHRTFRARRFASGCGWLDGCCLHRFHDTFGFISLRNSLKTTAANGRRHSCADRRASYLPIANAVRSTSVFRPKHSDQISAAGAVRERNSTAKFRQHGLSIDRQAVTRPFRFAMPIGTSNEGSEAARCSGHITR